MKGRFLQDSVCMAFGGLVKAFAETEDTGGTGDVH